MDNHLTFTVKRIFYMIVSFLPDTLFLKIKFRVKIGKGLNYKSVHTFNEKLQWLKLYDHNPNYPMLVDKSSVRVYVADRIGERHLVPVYGVFEHFEEIDFSKLPDRFIMKCTHDSGSTHFVDKNSTGIKKLKREIEDARKFNFFYASREWPYKSLKPRIIIEKNLFENSGEDMIDYKIMCFGGKAKCIFTCSGRGTHSGLRVTFFDLDWNRLPFTRHYPAASVEISRPQNLKKMIEYAEILADGLPFVRVDFYDVKGHVFFGEMTLYPGGGFEEFAPVRWDEVLGDWLDLSGLQNMKKSH